MDTKYIGLMVDKLFHHIDKNIITDIVNDLDYSDINFNANPELISYIGAENRRNSFGMPH